MAFATQVKRRRGTTAENDAFTGAEGEIVVDTEKHELRVHDGVTQGGFIIGSGGGGLTLSTIEIPKTSKYIKLFSYPPDYTGIVRLSINTDVYEILIRKGTALSAFYNTFNNGGVAVPNVKKYLCGGRDEDYFISLGAIAATRMQSVSIYHDNKIIIEGKELESIPLSSVELQQVVKGASLFRSVLKSVQLPTAENGYTWYRMYADGWVEMGGTNRDSLTVTFPVPLKSWAQPEYSVIYDNSGFAPYNDLGAIASINSTGFIKTGQAKAFVWRIVGKTS